MNRKSDQDRRSSIKSRILSPGVVLFLLSPFIGEFLPGSQTVLNFIAQPLPQVLVYLVLAAFYGSGALIVRELVLKWRKGWISIALLGLAYGILEEGLVAQSFSNPAWQGLSVPASYGRFLGVNWPWIENIIIYHALVSISLSILLVSLLFPGHNRERYTSGRTLSLCFVLLGFSVVLGESMYPYWSGALYYAAAVASILVLVFLARKAPPQATPRRIIVVPSWVFAVVALAATFLFYEIQYTLPRVAPPLITILTSASLVALVFSFLFFSRSKDGDAWLQYSLALGVVSYYAVWVPAFRPISAPNSLFDLVLIVYVGLRMRSRAAPERALRYERPLSPLE